MQKMSKRAKVLWFVVFAAVVLVDTYVFGFRVAFASWIWGVPLP